MAKNSQWSEKTSRRRKTNQGFRLRSPGGKPCLKDEYAEAMSQTTGR